MKNIKTKEEANCFLKEYLPLFNKQFAKAPKSNLSFFKQLSNNFNYEREFALTSTRVVNNDYTIKYNSRLFQIKDVHLVRRKQKVLIKESVYGNIRIFFKDRELKIKEIEKEKKDETKKKKRTTFFFFKRYFLSCFSILERKIRKGTFLFCKKGGHF